VARAKASAVAGIFLLLGVLICIEALQVPIGSFRMPGAGFFPLLLGLALAGLSLILLGMTYTSTTAAAPARVWPERPEVVYLVGSLLAAVWLFERAGFLITMTLFLCVALRVLGKKSWTLALVLGLAGSVAAYLVFTRGLQIALPSGILPT
jgi:putative tricarboxylic transport membrane protein